MEFIEISAKTVDEAITDALIKLGTTSDKIEYEVLEKGSTGVFGLFGKPAKIKAWKKEKDVKEIAHDFLSDVFKSMNMEVKIDIDVIETNNAMNIELSGDDMGVLIGKRGQTLDSLQYLVSLVVNKESKTFLKVKLDTENYRARRRETLETLAKNIAYKVKRTKRAVSLEPMNPYERRVIHSALQSDKYVSTRSEGDEPFRHVVVYLKK